MVTVDTRSGDVRYNVEYYVLGHVSRFVAPGAVRVDSTTYGRASVETVAFRNPDGRYALIVLNSADEPRTFGVRGDGRAFLSQLPAGAVATFCWE